MPIKQIIFNTHIIKFLRSELAQFNNLETGGVLLGYIKDNIIYIEKASGSGPNAIHEPYFFKADSDFVDMFIDIEIANSYEKLRYIGEWHSHLQFKAKPSDIDLESLWDIADTTNDFCLLLIIGAVEFKNRNFINKSITLIKYKDCNEIYSLPSIII